MKHPIELTYKIRLILVSFVYFKRLRYILGILVQYIKQVGTDKDVIFYKELKTNRTNNDYNI